MVMIFDIHILIEIKDFFLIIYAILATGNPNTKQAYLIIVSVGIG